jgi:hypothetical protein
MQELLFFMVSFLLQVNLLQAWIWSCGVEVEEWEPLAFLCHLT